MTCGGSPGPAFVGNLLQPVGRLSDGMQEPAQLIFTHGAMP